MDLKVLDCHSVDHVDYWQCMEALCQEELNLAKKQESQEPGENAKSGSAFTRERQFYVEDEIKTMLAGVLSSFVRGEAEVNSREVIV